MASDDLQNASGAFERLRSNALGHSCGITRHEYSWGFRFEDRCWIMIECPWRIVSDGRLAFASQDDGHQFGLPAPVDGESRAKELIGSSPLVRLIVAGDTADLTLHFRNGARIDVINSSSGYEGWQAGYLIGDIETNIIGCGGGELAVMQSRADAKGCNPAIRLKS